MRILIGVIVVFCAVCPAAAREWHVPVDVPTIAAGLDSAVAGDEVVLACGIYAEVNLALGADVVLRSENGDPACAVIDAPEQAVPIRVLEVIGDGGRIQGITITHGFAMYDYTGDFGAAVSVGGDVEMVDCVFVENEAVSGGAIAIYGGCALTAHECVILGNTATYHFPDVDMYGGSSAALYCCEVDLANWEGSGADAIEVFDDDCATATAHRTWGAVKSLFQ